MMVHSTSHKNIVPQNCAKFFPTLHSANMYAMNIRVEEHTCSETCMVTIFFANKPQLYKEHRVMRVVYYDA